MTITLATLQGASAQNILNQVWEHLIEQNAACKDEITDKCLYRSPDGLKCAVGCLIADDEYEDWMDNTDEDEGSGWLAMATRLNQPKHRVLIADLQAVHDSNSYPHDVVEWKQNFKDVAEKHGLEMPEDDAGV